MESRGGKVESMYLLLFSSLPPGLVHVPDLSDNLSQINTMENHDLCVLIAHTCCLGTLNVKIFCFCIFAQNCNPIPTPWQRNFQLNLIKGKCVLVLLHIWHVTLYLFHNTKGFPLSFKKLVWVGNVAVRWQLQQRQITGTLQTKINGRLLTSEFFQE